MHRPSPIKGRRERPTGLRLCPRRCSLRGALACRLGRYDTGVVSGALVLMDDELRLSATQKE